MSSIYVALCKLWALSVFFGVLELSFSLDFERLLFDRYPLERSSASYQKDLRPIVLEKMLEIWDRCTSFRAF